MGEPPLLVPGRGRKGHDLPLDRRLLGAAPLVRHRVERDAFVFPVRVVGDQVVALLRARRVEVVPVSLAPEPVDRHAPLDLLRIDVVGDPLVLPVRVRVPDGLHLLLVDREEVPAVVLRIEAVERRRPVGLLRKGPVGHALELPVRIVRDQVVLLLLRDREEVPFVFLRVEAEYGGLRRIRRQDGDGGLGRQSVPEGRQPRGRRRVRPERTSPPETTLQSAVTRLSEPSS